jgi:hypothetical protein
VLVGGQIPKLGQPAQHASVQNHDDINKISIQFNFSAENGEAMGPLLSEA